MLCGQDAADVFSCSGGPVPLRLHYVHTTHVSPPGGSKRPSYSTHSPNTNLVLHPQSLYFKTLMAFPVLDFVCLQCDDAEDAADLISINPLRSDNTRKEKRRTFLNKYFYRPSITGSKCCDWNLPEYFCRCDGVTRWRSLPTCRHSV